MKLFALLASSAALAHAQNNSNGWQDASDADVSTWRTDVMHASDTMKDIKQASCKLPEGKSLKQLGDPMTVNKHFYKLSSGNTRSTYQYKFNDGTVVYAGNSNVGETGGMWKIYCYRQGHDVVTKSPHGQNDLAPANVKKLRQIFKNIDTDGSGTITTGGAYTGLSEVFPSSSLPDFESTLEKESIKAAGKDKVVDLDEFECVAKKLYNIQKVYSEFKMYDTDHSMNMDRKELEMALMKFYFKDVAKPGLIQTVAIKAQVKKTVDAIITRNDKNGDGQVSWQEFEMDAFMEEHYNLGAKCQTSATPLNGHEVSVVENLLKKFATKGSKAEMSTSSWYQVVSMVTEQAIDAANGAGAPPSLGCGMPVPKGSGKGSGSGTHFGRPHDGGPVKVGGRVLLARALQTKPTGPKQTGKMTLMTALKALHKQADANHDGMISNHEILDVFQGVRDHLSSSDFGMFLDLVNKITGPVNCKPFMDCGKCTMAQNAGLCGWFQESSTGGGAFGGAVKSKGMCQFVDRSKNAENNNGADTAKPTTCSKQCHMATSNLRQVPV